MDGSGGDVGDSSAGGRLTRRTALRLTALAAVAAPTLGQLAISPAVHAQAAGATTSDGNGSGGDLVDVSIAALQNMLAAHRTTSRDITHDYLKRIRKLDPDLHSVIESNPDAESIAALLDDERKAGHVRGPLHGIPILLKDNIDTAD